MVIIKKMQVALFAMIVMLGMAGNSFLPEENLGTNTGKNCNAQLRGYSVNTFGISPWPVGRQ
jgi:hypothetical protein